ncbi:MAG: pilus assembly protein PilM [Chloroflexi bacterium]|nr:pilus assembly protein PilM [Chloroflexota bacterium]
MVTLEISSTDIRLIEVNGGKIVNWASRPLEPGVFSEEIISEPQALGNAIRALMASSGIKGKKVVTGVSGLYSLSRILTVLVAPEEPVTEQAILEATEAMIPISPDELYLSWQMLAAGTGERQALVVGVPRDIVDNEIRALKIAGINPDILDLKTLALARAVNRPEAIVLNIDASSFDIVILDGGTPEILHTTAWQPGALPVEEKAEQLISAIELTVTFYNTRHAGSPLDPAIPLIITGHLSGDTVLTGIIGDGVVYPIEPFTPPLEYPEHMPVPQFAVNIGLAMKASATPGLNLKLKLAARRRAPAANTKALSHSVPDLNLLPQTYKAWRPSAKQVYSSLAVAVLLGLLWPLYQLATIATSETATARQQYTVVNTQMEKRRLELTRREPIRKTIDQYKSTVAMGGGFVDDLAAIRTIAGELDVRVQGITHSGSSITFACEAADYVTFRQFIDALGESGRFTVSAVPPEGYPYIKGGPISLKPKR